MFSSIFIETLTGCNRECHFCRWGQDDKRLTVDMPYVMNWTLLNSIANQLKALGFRGKISPFLTNEPFLDYRMIEIIRLFKASCPDALITIVTNGHMLSNTMVKAAFDAGLGYLAVNAYDVDILSRVNGLNSRLNLEIIDRTTDDWPLDNRGGQIGSPAPSPLQQRCDKPSEAIAIKADGTMVLCDCDIFGKVAIADLTKTSLIDAWNSPIINHYRKALSEKNRGSLDLCRDCNYSGLPSLSRSEKAGIP